MVDHIVYIANNNGLSHIEDNTVDLVVTSPPYYNAKSYSQWNTFDEYLGAMHKVYKDCLRVLRPGRFIVWNVSDVFYEKRRIPIVASSIISMIHAGFTYRDCITWVKDGAGGMRYGSTMKYPWPRRYTPSFNQESIILMRKGERVKEYEKETEDTKIDREYLLRYRVDTWKIAPVRKINSKGENTLGHEAPFPVELPETVINLLTYPNELVLDPFMGSGTTAVAAIKTGRKSVGYEMMESYTEVISGRTDGKVKFVTNI